MVLVAWLSASLGERISELATYGKTTETTAESFPESYDNLQNVENNDYLPLEDAMFQLLWISVFDKKEEHLTSRRSHYVQFNVCLCF